MNSTTTPGFTETGPTGATFTYGSHGIDFRAEYKLATGYGVLSQVASLRLGWHF